ncbi:MAG: hydrolase TatD [Candidatus Magasanikbacteria bacterium CG11_big_fil_rev_8_21_14_0_20_39_34]|uniref:Hydrolase TatD n=1 Tax=Candidatus Magasanikbacteria bacterium CG11_big_fil_rev_8_21_14_0_20_39_34 TaxID=1974653 RepID=A0A2H0N5G6_9BACT|nr:MAG: hydrolase TatD [Candidatus Magasanikbacteria bacterium CG11_big_fil_rev_8_21_14_0_20_39_34]
MLFDTHCHIQFQAYKNDREAVLKKSLEKGVLMNMVGTQKDTSRMAVELAEQYENIYASIGTHPIHLHSTHVDEEESSFLSREESFDWDYYADLAKHEKVIAIGECGLDLFHIPKDISKEEVLEKQRSVFQDHIRFALLHNLPMVIHCRDAHDELIEMLSQLEVLPKGTIHCYTSNWDHAEKYLDMGFYLGFTGVITFPPKKTDPLPQEWLLEVVNKIPLDRVVVETDSPYLTPQINRGKRNEPFLVEEVVRMFAKVRELSYEEAEKITTQNAKTLFQLPL